MSRQVPPASRLPEATSPVTDPVLVRLAGFPVEMWLAAGDPALFADLRRLEALEAGYRQAAGVLAVLLGDRLVPQPRLRAADRGRALAVRRALHRGAVAAQDELAHVRSTCQHLGLDDLVERLTHCERSAAALVAHEHRLAARVAVAQQGLRRRPWDLLNGSAVGRQALLDGSIEHGLDVARRLRDGQSWDGKRLRRSNDYLWRMIARGATKTTPRGWLGHVAVAPPGTDGARVPRTTRDVATTWLANLHTGSAAGAGPLTSDSTVTLAPLQTVAGDRLTSWTVETGPQARVRSAAVRVTAPVATLRTGLADGPRAAADLAGAVLPGLSPDVAVPAGTRLLQTLQELGVLQVLAAPPVRRPDGWRPLGPAPAPAPAPAPDSAGPLVTAATTAATGCRGGSPRAGFLDVHRRLDGPWPAPDAERLTAAVVAALRIAALVRDDDGGSRWAPVLDEHPRPVVQAMAEHLAPERRPPAAAPAEGWRPPRRAGSGYARLLDHVAAQADDGADVVEVSSEVLDALGAPPRELGWPVDVTVRHAAGGDVVLDTVGPAGVLDARFAADLRDLHGGYRLVEQHRELLRRLDAATGVPSVELLAPPLSERAANAVRRPLYPRLWTGDADLDRYCTDRAGDEEHLPLSRLTVRRVHGRVLVEADGAPVRVVYHATRALPAAWDVLGRLLLADGPQAQSSPPRLRRPLAAFPERRHLPRVAVAGMVVAAAQWRVERREVPPAGDPALSRLRQLDRLRRRAGWPRWVFLSSTPHRAVACDLESVRALDTLDTLLGRRPGAAPVLVEEALPAPGDAPVRDAASGGHLLAEAVHRLHPAAVRTTDRPGRFVSLPHQERR